jgi:hypothetical protein
VPTWKLILGVLGSPRMLLALLAWLDAWLREVDPLDDLPSASTAVHQNAAFAREHRASLGRDGDRR